MRGRGSQPGWGSGRQDSLFSDQGSTARKGPGEPAALNDAGDHHHPRLDRKFLADFLVEHIPAGDDLANLANSKGANGYMNGHARATIQTGDDAQTKKQKANPACAHALFFTRN
jgi:hypothetical protein